MSCSMEQISAYLFLDRVSQRSEVTEQKAKMLLNTRKLRPKPKKNSRIFGVISLKRSLYSAEELLTGLQRNWLTF